MIRYFGRLSDLKLGGFCELSNKIYGISSKIGGSSVDSLYDRYSGKFVNQDLQKFKADVYKSTQMRGANKQILPGVTIITTPEECERCMDVLMNSNTIAAWDTETMDLDVKQEAPVGKGKIISASFFAGAEFNFGRGPRVFIDNFGKNAGLINYFKPYLESDKHLKVWHNYGFDRHVFHNHDINVRGFGGDTMHMARLLDPSKVFGGYSLSALTKEYSKNIERQIAFLKYIKERLTTDLANASDPKIRSALDDQINNIDLYQKYYYKGYKMEKQKLELLFGRKRMLKTGKEGITYQYPTTLTLHTNQEYIQRWIQYCVLDSESTFYLRRALQNKLEEQKADKSNKQLANSDYKKMPKTMWELYEKYWRPFGQILTDLQREGIKVDLVHMNKIAEDARHDLKKKEDYFLNFLYSFQKGKNIDHFNPSSPLQLQQLLFAPCQLNYEQANKKKEKQKKQEQQKISPQDRKLLQECQTSELSQKAAYDIAPKGGRKPVLLNELVKTFKIANKNGAKPKYVQMEVMGLGIPYHLSTPTGLPSVQQSVLSQLAGNPYQQKYGKAFDYFNSKGNPQFGKQLCSALKELVDYSSIETLLKTFIEPLISYVDRSGRVHCSLNINTETGRLSARKPNLQNQPALDKDLYKIRKAFVADSGKKFIVADYGQLQLRVLAHLTDCKAMIKAFKEGGDFHSRTAIGMYDYIRKEIEDGTILLEWDKSKGKAPAPLLKDKYAAQRKKAKTVNFSIAYGKTAKGFANDWGCSLNQAKEIIQAWFKDRPEVRLWQKQKQQIAQKKYYTQTLLGRYRSLKRFYDAGRNTMMYGMGERRAINTPIQGGAADIVIASMVKISRNQRLRQMGWKLLMQIHDELILEGPQQSAEEALALVKYDMGHPFDFDLRVELEVDAKIGNNWYECK